MKISNSVSVSKKVIHISYQNADVNGINSNFANFQEGFYLYHDKMRKNLKKIFCLK